jgi:hypothetical protein
MVEWTQTSDIMHYANPSMAGKHEPMSLTKAIFNDFSI